MRQYLLRKERLRQGVGWNMVLLAAVRDSIQAEIAEEVLNAETFCSRIA